MNNLEKRYNPDIKTIVFEKWNDPYLDDDFYDDEDEDLTYEEDFGPLKAISKGKFILTPMGAISVPEHGRPDSQFKFYTGHSNFKVTDRIVKLINDIDGIESLQVFTPYRFRISVGQLFNDTTVLRNVTNEIHNVFNSTVS